MPSGVNLASLAFTLGLLLGVGLSEWQALRQHEPPGWTVEARWPRPSMQPYLMDVTHATESVIPLNVECATR